MAKQRVKACAFGTFTTDMDAMTARAKTVPRAAFLLTNSNRFVIVLFSSFRGMMVAGPWMLAPSPDPLAKMQ